MSINTSHLQPSSKILIWAYRKGSGIIPNFARSYGTVFVKFSIHGNLSSEFRFEIHRSEINALDKEAQRCYSTKDAPTVAKCVEEKFVEKGLNCSLRRLMSEPLLGICNDSRLFSAFKATSSRRKVFHQHGKMFPKEASNDIFWKLNGLDEREIYDITGCMPGCSKSKIVLVPEYIHNMIDDNKNMANLSFVYPRGEYDLVEEYYIYDWGSFIADVGGHLGLLLGSSLLSMYHTTVPLLTDQIRSLVIRCKNTKGEN